MDSISIDRRTALKTLGVGVLAVGSTGTAAAKKDNSQDSDKTLRLFAEQAVDDTRELVTQGNYAYHATANGFAVVDIRNPGRPETVANVTVPESGPDILDVKVDGDLLGVAYNGTDGARFYDISDPADPQPLSLYENDSHYHNLFLAEGYAYFTRDSFTAPACEIVDVRDPENPAYVSQYTLTDDFPAFGPSQTNPIHDIYVQGDYLYMVFWDAGVVIADVSDKANPVMVSQFGDAPGADIPLEFTIPGFIDYSQRYYGSPGNAHYVQPSPDGKYVYVGAETFPGDYTLFVGGVPVASFTVGGVYGGIDVWDVSDYDNPVKVSTIDAPDSPDVFRTSHNFDVTNNRLYASWYEGGVTVHDITDPSNPEELYSYQVDGYQFWAAVRGRGFTLGGVYGADSDASAGGLLVLHEDRGKKTPPGFAGAGAPTAPESGLPSGVPDVEPN